MQVEFFKGNLANLPATGTPFAWYVVEDTQQIYRADVNGLIKLYSDIMVVGELPASGIANKLYVFDGKIYVWIDTWMSLTESGGGASAGLIDWATATSYSANQLVAHGSGMYKVMAAHTSTTVVADVLSGKLLPLVKGSTQSTALSYDLNGNIIRMETTGDSSSVTTFEYDGDNISGQTETTPLFIKTTVFTYDGDNISNISTSEERRV